MTATDGPATPPENPTTAPKRPLARRLPVAFSLLLATVGVWLHAGLPGAVVGLALVALALAGASAPALFAAVQVVVAALSPDGPALLVAEAGALGVLVVPATAHERWRRTLPATAVALLLALALWWASTTTLDATWQALLAVAAAVALAAYGLHRYEQLRLGLLDPASGGGAE